MDFNREIENLHIFDDSVGHYSNASFITYSRLQVGKHQVINLSKTKQQQLEGITYVESEQEVLKMITAGSIKRLFFHYLSFKSTVILERIKLNFPNIITVWVFWSGEFYGLPEKYRSLHTQETLPYIESRGIKSVLIPAMKSIFQFFRRWNKYAYSYEKLVKRYRYIDFLCTTFKADYENVIEETKAKHIKWLPYSYVSIDEILSNLPAKYHGYSSQGEHIMVGHSSSPSNNHIEILNKLAKWKSENSIYLPLGYGDVKYKNAIKELVARDFSRHSVILQEDLLPLDLYYKKLTTVGYAVINSKVQKAFGNIVVLLWLGVKVFLREETSIYIEFKKYGIHVFSIQNDFKENAITPLEEDEKIHNKRLLKQIYSAEKIERQMLHVFNL